MVSDILTAIIVLLMALLVIYPSARLVVQSVQARQRRQAQRQQAAPRR